MSSALLKTTYTAMQAEIMRREFIEFIPEAWRIIEPGADFIGNWHIDAIAEHLTYVSLGDIDDLCINMPPRTSKSSICSVLWPAWEWTHMPHTQWLCATYASTLTVRDSVKCRKLIQSPWYQERYGDIFSLTRDQNQKTRFNNDKNGYRIATSVGGTATGEGGDRILVDDAHNMKEIHSPVKRNDAISWWRDTMSTRGNNPKTLARVMISQRGHHMDLTGYCLSSETWVHLNMPGYYRKKTRCRTVALKDSVRSVGLKLLKKGDVIFTDPRKEENELLNPARFDQAAMQKITNELTKSGFAAQIQQDPSVDGGNILKEDSWRLWDQDKMPEIDVIIQVYDTAFEKGEENDYSARTTWGVFNHQEIYHPDNQYSWANKGKTRRCAILLERMEERLDFPELVENAKEAFKKWEPDTVLVEKKASGHSLIQEMKRAGVPVKKVKVTDSKIVRAHAAALTLDQGCIFFPEKKWARAVIKTCAEFPSGQFDDLVDTVTMLCLWLRKINSIDYAGENDDEINLMDQFREKKFY